jgi:tRNA-splicing ligase RtcB
MPDVHLARDVCVGVVVATKQLIYPQAVGNDIGCGMEAVALEADVSLIRSDADAARVLAGLYRYVPSNKHRQRRDLPAAVESSALSDDRLRRAAERDGRVQFGTLGRGNHFLELQADHESRLWLMVHSGSRGVGQLIARHHLDRCNVEGRLPFLDSQSAAGSAYTADVSWARKYAHENRIAMLRALDELFQEQFGTKIDWPTLITCDHNHVQKENHFGQDWWIHRKGAQPAFETMLGLIPGSMGTASFHVRGKGMADALCSCSHGAGRRQSRQQARQNIGIRTFEGEMKEVWFDHRRASALRDEAPSAYKDIREVMRNQRELIRIERELQPLLSYKGT